MIYSVLSNVPADRFLYAGPSHGSVNSGFAGKADRVSSVA